MVFSRWRVQPLDRLPRGFHHAASWRRTHNHPYAVLQPLFCMGGIASLAPAGPLLFLRMSFTYRIRASASGSKLWRWSHAPLNGRARPYSPDTGQRIQNGRSRELPHHYDERFAGVSISRVSFGAYIRYHLRFSWTCPRSRRAPETEHPPSGM